MSAAGTPSTDPWLIQARERARYEEQFKSLKPVNGIVTGDQVKGFLLQSQLPPLVLGQIWNLADTNSDGKMDITEFSIACKLINLKLRGFEIPKGLPPSLLASLQAPPPAIPTLPANVPVRPQPPVGTVLPTGMAPIPTGIVQPMVPPPQIPVVPPYVAPIPPTVAPLVPAAAQSPVAPAVIIPGVPTATSTPRASITSLESPNVDWAVPQHTKLKYTQMFNSTDRTRSGYLSGAQARNVMVQTKLPQSILAQIWTMSDMDGDGRLGCEEFVLAMHLCEVAATGQPLPQGKLPPELIPPSFRTRTASISSQGSATAVLEDPASTLLQTSFEDKRKENFEKGQAELERRRKTLLDQQRKEAEERERKEREEIERREKARLEAERKRMEELEKQMREQQEQERLKEEERKRQAEQREIARKEMERQRQLEWEKQRLQELQQQRQREQENVLKLKAKNQSLTIELSSLNEQVRELSQKICDTRVGVSNVKSTIDGMRTTRDAQMQEMSQLKNKLKEQNAKLLSLSQEKVKLEAKNKLNAQGGGAQDEEQARIAFENKEVIIKNLREKIADMQEQIDGKLSDIENNNSQLTDLRTQMTELIKECEQLYGVYETKRSKVLELKSSNKNIDYNAGWQSNDAWANEPTADTNWPANDNWSTSAAPTTTTTTTTIPGVVKYRALYEFAARNNDEISFQPGDIINVPTEQTGEPGWLAGEIRGHTGWFPESYVEPLDANVTIGSATIPYGTDAEADAKRLEGIVEEVPAPEEIVPQTPSAIVEPIPEGEIEYCIANYPYQSQEQGDLTFNAGETIAVIKKEGDWWTGKIGNKVGIFPSNYVQKVDVNATQPASSALSTSVNADAVTSALENVSSQADNEVSQINEAVKAVSKPLDASITANAQVMKSKKPEIAQVIAPYQATSNEQLSLARGQLIMIRKKTDSGWWEGELQAKGRKRQVGWFPASYVKVLNSSGRASGRTTPVSTTRMQQEVVIDKVVALFPYTAQNADELTFAKDDIISVTAREEEAWWRGELNGVSGLFPSNYVAPLQTQSISASGEERKRLECIKELIDTEKAYVRDMSTVYNVFELPLRKSNVVKKRDIDEIFVNWQDILQCNKNFLRDLQSRKASGSSVVIVGDIICQHLPLMSAYVTFCAKQLDSAALLQNLTESSVAFRDVIKRCQGDPNTKGLPLSSFLIKPMQRITRYPLMISKILENTPDNHPDFPYLKEALKIAERFLNCVNENIRLKEDQERLDWLQQYVQSDSLQITYNSNTNKLGPRRLLHHGILTKLKNGKELLVFLFNDFLMMVQASKSLGTHFVFQRNNNGVTYKIYKQPILVINLEASRESTENVEHGTDSNRVIKLADNQTKYKILVLASTVNECNLWMKRIEEAKQSATKLYSISTNKRPKSLPVGTVCGRLLVLVQKGKRFAVSGKLYTENVYCKASLGNQEEQTPVAKPSTQNGSSQNNTESVLVWNHSFQMQLHDINRETVLFSVHKANLYSPDDFLGRAELKVLDIYNESQNTNGPIIKKLILHQVESGEIIVKLDFHLFKTY